MTPLQENALRELTDKCFILLRETYPHGTFFADTVKVGQINLEFILNIKIAENIEQGENLVKLEK